MSARTPNPAAQALARARWDKLSADQRKAATELGRAAALKQKAEKARATELEQAEGGAR